MPNLESGMGPIGAVVGPSESSWLQSKWLAKKRVEHQVPVGLPESSWLQPKWLQPGVEDQIEALALDPVTAARRLLKTFSSIPKEPKSDSDKKNLELIRPHLNRIAGIAMKNPMLHSKLAKAAVGTYSYHGHELLSEVFKNVKEKEVPMPSVLESKILGKLNINRAYKEKATYPRIDEKKRAVLTQHMSTITVEALKNPMFHEELLDIIYFGYKYRLKKDKDSRIELISSLTKQVALKLIQVDNAEEVGDFVSRFVDSFYEWQRLARVCFANNCNYTYSIARDLVDSFVENKEQLGKFLKDKGLSFDKSQAEVNVVSISDYCQFVISIIRLEHMSPGICSRLQKGFGISSFHRYPSEFLINLDKEGHNKDNGSRRVLIVVAAHDYNGALAFQERYKRYLGLKKFGIEPLLFEVSSLEKLDTLVGSTDFTIRKQIFQVEILGHGTREDIFLGVNGEGRQNIEDSNLGKLGDIFEKMHGVKNIILSSCSVGREEDGEGKN